MRFHSDEVTSIAAMLLFLDLVQRLSLLSSVSPLWLTVHAKVCPHRVIETYGNNLPLSH